MPAAGIKVHNQKQLGEERVYFPSTSQSIIRGSQDENLEAGPDMEAMERHSSGFALYGLLGLLSYTTQGHQLRGGFTHSELGPQTSIINQENVPGGLERWLSG